MGPTNKMNLELAEEARRLRREGWSMRRLRERYSLGPHCLRDVIHERTFRRVISVEVTSASWATIEEHRGARSRDEFVRELLVRALTGDVAK